MKTNSRTKEFPGDPPKEMVDTADYYDPRSTMNRLAVGMKNPDVATLNLMIRVEASPDKVSFELIRRGIAKLVKEHPEADYVFPKLVTLVNVMGPEIFDDDRALQTAIEESNENQWVPTKGWVQRDQYNGRIVLSSQKFNVTEGIASQVTDLLEKASQDDDDNKFIFVVGVALQFGVFTK